MPGWFRVVNWERFQGEIKRKQQGPDWVAPWFKVYHRLLDDYDFSNLPEAQRFLWLGILCLAARTRNHIRTDSEYLRHQLRTKMPIPLDSFQSFGWIEMDGGNDSRIVPESFAKDSAPEEIRGEEIRGDYKKKNIGARKFSPPSLEEIREFVSSQAYGVDAQKFHDYYTSNGWRVGKNPMKDWRAAVRTWQHNGTKPKVEREWTLGDAL